MSETAEKLAEELLSTTLFNWCPGMRWITADDSPLQGRMGDIVWFGVLSKEQKPLPDLRDPATIGALFCMLEMEGWFICQVDNRYFPQDGNDILGEGHLTMLSAIVDAFKRHQMELKYDQEEDNP